MYIGNSLKKIRTEMNLTQEEMSKKLDISIHTYRKYEQDLREPKFDILQKMADALKIPLNDLLGTSETFESDFKISELGSIVEDYIMEWRNDINAAFKGKYFSNSDIVRNLLIDLKARDDAEKEMNIGSEQNKSILFMTANEKPLEPNILYEILKKEYIERIREERKKELAPKIKEAHKIALGGVELPEHYKIAVTEFYEDSHINKIPLEFKKYFQNKIDQYKEYEEMKKQNEEYLKLDNEEYLKLDKEELKKLKTMEIIKED